MDYDRERLEDSLKRLDKTSSSIEDAGLLFQQEGQKGFHRQLAQLWLSQTQKSPSISLLYLAN